MDPPKSPETIEKYKDYTNSKNPGILIIFKFDKVRLINNLAPNYFNKELVEQIPCVSNIVLFEKLNDDMRFYFTGLHHPFVKENVTVQDKQINFLLEKINELNSNNFPVIIAGDFNSKPTSNVYQIMNNNNYNSVYTIFNGDENKYTAVNSFTNERFTLDYIFIDKKSTVKDVYQIDKTLENNNIPNKVFPSDHVFLIANISI